MVSRRVLVPLLVASHAAVAAVVVVADRAQANLFDRWIDGWNRR